MTPRMREESACSTSTTTTPTRLRNARSLRLSALPHTGQHVSTAGRAGQPISHTSTAGWPPAITRKSLKGTPAPWLATRAGPRTKQERSARRAPETTPSLVHAAGPGGGVRRRCPQRRGHLSAGLPARSRPGARCPGAAAPAGTAPAATGRLCAARTESRWLRHARRRGSGAAHQHATEPETSDRRPRRGRAAIARRAASRQRAQHEVRTAVHRSRDVLPWARRVRPRPCPRRCQ